METYAEYLMRANNLLDDIGHEFDRHKVDILGLNDEFIYYFCSTMS